MSSVVNDLENTRQRNSSKNFVDDEGLKVKEISSLIDSLPVTVFRTSNDSSWSIHYISENVDELTGYSRMDFISKKLSWSDIVYPEMLRRLIRL